MNDILLCVACDICGLGYGNNLINNHHVCNECKANLEKEIFIHDDETKTDVPEK